MRLIMLGSASSYGREVVDLIEMCWKYELVGVLDRNLPVGTLVLGYGVLGGEEDLPAYFEANHFDGGVIAVCDNWHREEIAAWANAIAPGFVFPPLVHPTAQIGKAAAIGPGSVVGDGVVINADARIGDFCVLRQNSSLGHESVVGNFACLSEHVATGGNVRIGRGAAIGDESVVIHGISIGECSSIDAGSVVVRDLPAKVRAGGNPARIKETGSDRTCMNRVAS